MNRTLLAAVAAASLAAPTAAPAKDPAVPRFRADLMTSFFDASLNTPDQYRSARTAQAKADMLNRDRVRVELWGGYLTDQIKQFKADEEELLKLQGSASAAKKLYHETQAKYDLGMSEANARQAAADAFDASTSAADFRDRVKGVARVGVVSDYGYFYRYYDESGGRQGGGAADERREIKKQKARLADINVELGQQAKDVTQKLKEFQDRQAEYRMDDRRAGILAARDAFVARMKQYDEVLASIKSAPPDSPPASSSDDRERFKKAVQDELRRRNR